MDKYFLNESVCFSLQIEPFEGEVFKDIIGYDGIYSVSNLGRVKSEYRELEIGYVKERIRKIQVNPYTNQCQVNLTVNRKTERFLVSHLVADAFIKNTQRDGKKLVVAHKNKNPKDNRLDNLLITSKSTSCKITYAKGSLDHSILIMADIAKERGERRKKDFGIFENGVITGYICTRCFVEKPLNEFSASNTFCNTCKSKADGVADIGKIERRKHMSESAHQECSVCKNVKPFGDFWKSKHTTNGIYSSCKKCGYEKHALKKNIKNLK